jgi:hypothetical protein
MKDVNTTNSPNPRVTRSPCRVFRKKKHRIKRQQYGESSALSEVEGGRPTEVVRIATLKEFDVLYLCMIDSAIPPVTQICVTSQTF